MFTNDLRCACAHIYFELMAGGIVDVVLVAEPQHLVTLLLYLSIHRLAEEATDGRKDVEYAAIDRTNKNTKY